jgi:multiple sugar transport system substrate-binding protein
MLTKWVTAAAVSGLLLAGPAGAVELKVWAKTELSPAAALGPVATAFTDLYDKFQKENPDITLKYEMLPGGTEALSSLLTAASAGNLPDVAILDSFWVARLVETGYLQPLDALWPEAERQGVLPAAIDSMTFDGKIYAVMFSNAWRGLFYRPSQMHALGIDTAPDDWDSFLAFAEKAKAAGMMPIMVPGADTEVTTLHLIPAFWGFGGDLVDDAGKPIFFEGKNREALEKVYGLYRDLVTRGFLSTDVATMDEKALRPFFYTGETAAIANSSSGLEQMYSDAPQLKGDIDAFPLPLPGGGKAAPMMGGQTWGIFAADDEHKQAAWKLVSFMTAPENLSQIDAAKGYLPVNDAVWAQPFYADDPLMQQFKAIFATASVVKTRPPVPIYPTTSSALSQQVADVLTGKLTPAAAVDSARDIVMAEYARQTAR